MVSFMENDKEKSAAHPLCLILVGMKVLARCLHCGLGAPLPPIPARPSLPVPALLEMSMAP